jgi:peptidoglycan/LPS O-acetylase OafA/YrhL
VTARLPGLDVLRIVGAALVLFAHGGYFLFAAWPWYEAYEYAGWIGTEVFFALTGLLVMREAMALPAGDLRAAARYTAWRMWRIVPLFWVALLSHALLARFGQRPLPADAWQYALLVQNVAQPHPAFFGEAWNLPLIALASIFLPGVALGAASFAKPRMVAAVMLGALLVVGLALRAEWILEGAARWDEDVRKVVIARLDACTYGALAALSWAWLGSRVARGAAAVAVLALAIATLLFFALPRDASLLAKWMTFAACGIAMAAACAALAWPWRERPMLARVARWVYPLYLVNMPLLLGFALIGFGQTLSPSSSVMRFGAWVLASIALAALVHYAMERPLLEWGRRAIKPAGAGAASRPAARTGRGPAG